MRFKGSGLEKKTVFNSEFWIQDEITESGLVRSCQIIMSRARGVQQEMFTNISWNKAVDTLLHLKCYGKKVKKEFENHSAIPN